MKKLTVTRTSPTYKELIGFYKKEKDNRLRERYHALFLMHELNSCTKVAEILKRTPRCIQKWVNAFNEGGLVAITPKTIPGRPPRLSRIQKEELKKDVLTHPRELGYDFSNWEGKTVSLHVKKKFNVSLKVRQCQYLLHKLGFTLQRPKYQFPRADPKAREEFIKQLQKK